MEIKRWHTETMVSCWSWNSISLMFWLCLESIADFELQTKSINFSNAWKKVPEKDPAWKKLIMNSIGICMFSLAYSVVRVSNFVFHVINKYFNSIDKSFILNCLGRYFLNFSFFVFHLALKISYAIKCCNCYFDMYLLEINQRPELMDSDKTSYIDIIRIRHRRTEWKAKNELGQWFLTDGEIIFHSCFGYIHQVLQNSTYRKDSPILEVLWKKCITVEFW